MKYSLSITMLKKIFLTVAFVNFIVLNVAVGYLVWKNYDRDLVSDSDIIENKTLTQEGSGVGSFGIGENTSEFVCDEKCQKIIEDKVADLLPTYIPSITLKPVPTAVSTSVKTKFVSYIPIPGSGNTANTVWTDLAGTEFSFSVSDYVGFKEAYFEANIKLFNGNGIGYVRLYDITNSRAVDGSEISTSSQISTAVSSGKVSLWLGNNRFKIQARSLTADTTYFESGRLKIINEQ